MNLISVAGRSARNGVSDYAVALEREFERLGCNVTPVSFLGAWRLSALRRPFDFALIHEELSEGLRRFDLMTLSALLAALRSRLAMVMFHTVLRERDLQSLGRPLRRALLLYERALFANAGRRAMLAALTQGGTAEISALSARSALHFRHGFFAADGAQPRGSDSYAPVTIGLIGHAYAFKRFEAGLAAYEGLKSTVKAKARLVIVGGGIVGDRAWAPSLRILASHPRPDVEITGPLDEAAFQRALARIDIALFPYEDRLQASSALARAVGSGCACVVSNASIFEGLVGNRAALQARDWPADAIAAIESLVTDRGLLGSTSQRALAYSSAFPLSATARAILEAAKERAGDDYDASPPSYR
jgi:hypothetical protein